MLPPGYILVYDRFLDVESWRVCPLPVLGPLEAFLVGYALVVVLSSRRVKVYLSLLAMIVVFGLLALTPGAVGRSVVELGE
ncbi:MAG: hypothetical protein LRS48_06610, partial [Desulfurococcales archaeon]|nr:hypothetical protein [Desulfurococcales archaeon]